MVRAAKLVSAALGLFVLGISLPSVMPVSAQTSTTLNVFDDGDTNIEQLFTDLGAQYHNCTRTST